MTTAEKLYTKDEIHNAVNAGVDLVGDELTNGGLGERDTDLLNIAAKAILSLLDNPGMSLDDVLDENWGDEEEGSRQIPPREYIRKWWDW